MFRAIARIGFVVLAAVPMMAAAIPAEEEHRDSTAWPGQASAPRSQSNDSWCDEAQRNDDREDRETFCEVRDFTLGAGAVAVETSNGSIRVTGERRSDVLVVARVVTYARDAARAREIARDIAVTTSGTIRATGPRTANREGWHVGFRIQAPEATDLDLVSSNGSLGVTGVRGRLRMRTSNGSIALTDVAGDVQADTSNGSVNAILSGTRWDGTGLDVSTSNGSVRLTMPENYNARLTAGTSNGTIRVGFPITVQGELRRNRDIDTTIGSGGPPIRVRTSNGSVSIGRPGERDRDRR
ncbi:MAG: DUF4097 family beta strand repeat-containing protein [Vicinamibacterales bacterium]